MPNYMDRARAIEALIDKKNGEIKMAYNIKKHFQEPFERWMEEEDALRRKSESPEKRGSWVCSYCGSTQPPMDFQCRECGAPKE